MGKLIFLDIDGTLVDYKTRLPDSAVKAVRKARENGHKIFLCTGRSKAEIYPQILDLGFDGIIGGNGCFIEVNDKEIFHKTLTFKQVKRISDWLKIKGLEFYAESNSGLYASENFETAAKPVVKEYMYRIGEKPSKEITVREAFPAMIFGDNPVREDINKISFILKSYEDYLEAKELFSDLSVGHWGGIGDKALFGDIGVKGISKGDAVKTLINFLEMDPEDTIAFGDARTDIPMLEACQIGVAMGNGDQEIKQVADIITDDVEKDGLFKAFEELNLI